MPDDPRTPFYAHDAKVPRAIVRSAAAVSIVAFAVTLWIVCDAWNTASVIRLYLAIGAWAVVPPTWFWIEYFYVYRRYGQPDTLELFKYGQDVAKAIWAGVLAGLIAFAAAMMP
jgi:hypothetical protein